VRAFMDCYQPKLVIPDIEVLQSVLITVFPGNNICWLFMFSSSTDRDATLHINQVVADAITQAIKHSGLVQTDGLQANAIQLYECVTVMW